MNALPELDLRKYSTCPFIFPAGSRLLPTGKLRIESNPASNAGSRLSSTRTRLTMPSAGAMSVRSYGSKIWTTEGLQLGMAKTATIQVST
jgi:hypothetical protein